LDAELDTVVLDDVGEFIRALRFVSQSALVHNASALDALVESSGLAQKEVQHGDPSQVREMPGQD
jgi:hypothetical protein